MPGSCTAPSRPDIVFVVADDLGYADLGCYGGRHTEGGAVSPHIDALAAAGVRFTRGYANSSVCSPTRFALMTGRWQYRLRGAAEEPINSALRGGSTVGLPPDHPTLASVLRDVGYRTVFVGKWHLGYPPHFGPLRSGDDEFHGPMSGGVDYFSHCTNQCVHDLWEGAAERHDTAPHWPWQTREDAHVTAHIGRLDNTLLVFTNDNGGERFSDKWPLVGGKMGLTEGGIRVPWIAHWPARVVAGAVCDQHCLTMDWTATLIEAAGATPAADWPLDGLSLLGVLTAERPTFARPMHWRMKHREQRALREGRWKYRRVDGLERIHAPDAERCDREPRLPGRGHAPEMTPQRGPLP